jgi:hypothetical protein
MESSMSEENLNVTPDEPVVNPVVETPDNPATENNQAPNAEPEGDKGDEGQQKHKGGWQKRVDTLTARMRMLEAQLEQERAQKSQPAASGKPAEAVAPKMEDYDNVDEYINAVTDYKVQSKLGTHFQQYQQQTQEQQIQRTFAEKQNAVRAEYEDYDEAVNPAMSYLSQFNPHVVAAVLRADNGPDVAYKISKDPSLVNALVRSDPYTAAMTIGQLAVTVKAEKANRKKVSSAAPPIKPVDAGLGGAGGEPDVTKMSAQQAHDYWSNKNRR